MAAIIPAGIAAAGSIISSIIANRQKKPTHIQEQQSEMIDRLMASIDGNGPYADLFKMDENQFQQSYVNPMKQMFDTQIAPQIQQSYIAAGKERGSGMNDALTRAGVDMNQQMNQAYMQQQQAAMTRRAGAMSNILDQPAGVQPQMSGDEAALQGAGGYLGGSFGKDIGNILSLYSDNKTNDSYKDPRDLNSLEDLFLPARKGFEKESQVYNPYTGIMR